ncbi:hypothetical protein CEXT_249361 [Caerostris extrusa]|uniref:Uncharacterized protein n=1 Tax=Caerostris extrusa TaxID=172846 RepID=A0AAV4W6T3_CAEEX|nr:hypothetical protein CEXT_249361 [Caerostris extrusa]
MVSPIELMHLIHPSTYSSNQKLLSIIRLMLNSEDFPKLSQSVIKHRGEGVHSKYLDFGVPYLNPKWRYRTPH